MKFDSYLITVWYTINIQIKLFCCYVYRSTTANIVLMKICSFPGIIKTIFTMKHS